MTEGLRGEDDGGRYFIQLENKYYKIRLLLMWRYRGKQHQNLQPHSGLSEREDERPWEQGWKTSVQESGPLFKTNISTE